MYAAIDYELQQASPLPGNAFKLELARRAVTATVMEIA